MGVKFCLDDVGHYSILNNDDNPLSRSASDNPYEVNRRLHALEVALRNEKTTPVLVTICRSMRDGYTNPHLWKQIESGILELLGKSYGKLDVVYDRNLMGGVLGLGHHARVLL